jgi:plastocyanin
VTVVWRTGAVALLAAALAGPAGRQEAGSIRGRVSFANPPKSGERPAPADPANRRHPAPEQARAVVYLDPAPRQAFDELPVSRPRMDQRGEQFAPRVLAITAGSTVDFPNSDVTFHNVFSLSATRKFDLGRYRPGRTGAVKFDHAGIVYVFCDIHSHMSAFILVFNHRFFSVTDADGRYTLDRVPPGSHNVMVWSETGQPPLRRVTVLANEVAEADFRIGRQP